MALTRVAGMVAAVGQPGRGEQAARSITDPDRQAAALRAVAKALVAAGQPERAEQVARNIADPYQHVLSLVDVVGALARRDENSAQARSRAIVAEVLVGNSWYYAMPALASLDPGAATAIGAATLRYLKHWSRSSAFIDL
jgi:Flp pilus assembly protein TadD